jgi:hypothetical protein
MAWPATGATVCRVHGGAAGQVQAATSRRIERAQAEADARTFGVPEDLDPAEAVLREVATLAGTVTWLRERVATLDPNSMVWGITKQKTGLTPAGPVDVTEHAAQVNMWVRLLGEQQDRLLRACDIAVRLGLEARRVKLAEEQGRVLAGVLRASLADLGLDDGTQERAHAAIARHLRAVGGARGE